MYRTDGYRVKTTDAMYELVPYIMPYRYDASNCVKVDIDLSLIQDYVRECRKKGISMSHMSIIIAGALRLVLYASFLISWYFIGAPSPFFHCLSVYHKLDCQARIPPDTLQFV